MNPYIIQPTQMQQTTQAVGTPDLQIPESLTAAPYTAPNNSNLIALAAALRTGKKKNNGITNSPTGLAYDANGTNPYAYIPQEPDYSQAIGNLFSTRD